MHVISRKTLQLAATDKKYAEIAKDLDAWYRHAIAAKWENLLDAQKLYLKAEPVRVGDDTYTVFNLRHNRFRLVVKIVYPSTIFVKYVLTHREYDSDEWKKALKNEQRERETRRKK